MCDTKQLAHWRGRCKAAEKTVVVYLKGCQLCAVHVNPEGVQVLRAGVGQNAAALQGHSWLAHFVLALVLVKP